MERPVCEQEGGQDRVYEPPVVRELGKVEDLTGAVDEKVSVTDL